MRFSIKDRKAINQYITESESAALPYLATLGRAPRIFGKSDSIMAGFSQSILRQQYPTANVTWWGVGGETTASAAAAMAPDF